MFLFLLFWMVPLAAADLPLPPFQTLVPTIYRYTNYLNIQHAQGPVRVKVMLCIKVYPVDNLVNVQLFIYHRRRLVTSRDLDVFW